MMKEAYLAELRKINAFTLEMVDQHVLFINRNGYDHALSTKLTNSPPSETSWADRIA